MWQMSLNTNASTEEGYENKISIYSLIKDKSNILQRILLLFLICDWSENIFMALDRFFPVGCFYHFGTASGVCNIRI